MLALVPVGHVVILCRMAADLVPICLSLTAGDRYTVWAPRWRDAGDEWEAFLGKDDDLYAFETAADLVAFVRANTDNDLVDHPGWTELTKANAHKLDPASDQRFDLITVEELVSEKPTEESVTALGRTLAIVSSLGSVCELAAVTKFFNGNPNLGTLGGGMDRFTGKAGRRRWNAIADVIARSWDDVLTAVDGVVNTPDVDTALSSRAADELAEEPEEPEEKVDDEAVTDEEPAKDAAGTVEVTPGEDDEHDEKASPTGDDVVLGDDEGFWLKVGIDPIQIITGTGTLYTLRCYFDDHPIFLGRNGRISVFSSERALARYLADEHDHDLSDLSTYDDIRTAATDGSLRVDVTVDNVYVLTGLVDDFADGPDSVDREQLDLAVELLHDVGDYAEDNTVDKALATQRPLGKVIAHVLEPGSVAKPKPPYTEVVREWEALDRFVESRLRRE
jgi:hypothetical protein